MNDSPHSFQIVINTNVRQTWTLFSIFVPQDGLILPLVLFLSYILIKMFPNIFFVSDVFSILDLFHFFFVVVVVEILSIT